MGGRGVSSNRNSNSVSERIEAKIKNGTYKMPTKKNEQKSVKSYLKRIKEHENKISTALETNVNKDAIDHWQKEINAFEKNLIKKLRK